MPLFVLGAEREPAAELCFKPPEICADSELGTIAAKIKILFRRQLRHWMSPLFPTTRAMHLEQENLRFKAAAVGARFISDQI